MYIAVILENYSQATEDVQEGLTDDDYDMYYEIWQQFDPEGTQYLPYNQLSDFLDVLEPPLQIHKPNKYKIISMDIPICKGDFCFCVDVLDALTKDFFARYMQQGTNIQERFAFYDVKVMLKSCASASNRYIMNLSNEVLNIHCGQVVVELWVPKPLPGQVLTEVHSSARMLWKNSNTRENWHSLFTQIFDCLQFCTCLRYST